MNKRFVSGLSLISMVIFSTLFLLIYVSVPTMAEVERSDGYFTLVDGEGRTICRTAHQVEVGDEYLTADNILYRVEEVDEDTAHVRFVERVKLNSSASSLFSRVWRGISRRFSSAREFMAQGEKKRPVAIYHTHSDESYIPTEGRSSVKYSGGIFQVGETLARALKERGIPVIQDKTPHDPHDAMAYDRSRRTAVDLLKQNPVAVLDIHRDAVPRGEYTDEVNNTTVSKIQLVVGRQNPNQGANDAFARQLKEAVDRRYPGLVKGIFYGEGKYNQDLAPRLILVEIGTHTNTREEAERGAAIFASAAEEVLAQPQTTNRAVGGGAGRSLGWIIGLLVAGVAIFLLLNGGLAKIRNEFGRWTGGAVDLHGEEGTDENNGPTGEGEN